MKGISGVAAVFAAAVFVTSAARADSVPAWIQVPGRAIEIGVGASNYPWVLDTVQHIEYLDQSNTSCGSDLCVSNPIWRSMHGLVKHLSVDLYGFAWTMDFSDQLWWGEPGGGVPGVSNEPTGFLQCVDSFSQGIVEFENPQRYTFPHFFGPDLPDGNRAVDLTYVIGCGGGSMVAGGLSMKVYQKLIPQPGTPQGPHFQTGFKFSVVAGPVQVDTGESLVTRFTVDGSFQQIPWILAPLSRGGNTVWAFNNGTFRAAPKPANLSITTATDHYVVAGNAVWHWNGDAYGNRGNPVWSSVISAPPNATIKQIAYASAVSTPNGMVGPSQLWMIDTNGNIYYLGTIESPK